MCEKSFTTNVGDYLVIKITGGTELYIAEVIQSKPLQMKAEEIGAFSYLKAGEYIICEEHTVKLQEDRKNEGSVFLEEMKNKGIKPLSGLKSLNVVSGKLHEILPVEKNS